MSDDGALTAEEAAELAALADALIPMAPSPPGRGRLLQALAGPDRFRPFFADPGKRRVASSQAAGVPTATMIASAIALHSKLSRSASSAAPSSSELTRSRGAASANTATTGSARNATASARAAPQTTAKGLTAVARTLRDAKPRRPCRTAAR